MTWQSIQTISVIDMGQRFASITWTLPKRRGRGIGIIAASSAVRLYKFLVSLNCRRGRSRTTVMGRSRLSSSRSWSGRMSPNRKVALNVTSGNARRATRGASITVAFDVAQILHPLHVVPAACALKATCNITCGQHSLTPSLSTMMTSRRDLFHEQTTRCKRGLPYSMCHH